MASKIPLHRSMAKNKNTYESDVVVQYLCLQIPHLQKPEETILNMLKEKLPRMKMLDIGVGAGRTTTYFAPLSYEYVGVDYSVKMIRACRKKFRNYPKKIRLEIADVRDLNLFNDKYFDFTLFSFNGLDLIDHDDRLRALREVRRVTKNNGYFCFSSHNLNATWKLCTFKPDIRKPVKVLRESRRLLLMRLINRKDWKILRERNHRNLQHLIFNDGAENFKLKTYYITPMTQIDQLTELNFKFIRSYNLLGKEINSSELHSATDYWLYYLCNV